jgi:hypothetical protein
LNVVSFLLFFDLSILQEMDGTGDPALGEIRKASRVGELIRTNNEKKLFDVLCGIGYCCVFSRLR